MEVFTIFPYPLYLCFSSFFSIFLPELLLTKRSTFLWLFLSPSLCLPLSLSAFLCLSQFICLSEYLYVSLSVFESFCVWVFISLTVSLNLFVALVCYLSVHLSLCFLQFSYMSFLVLSFCPPRYLSVIFGELLWTSLPSSWRHVSGCEPNEGGSHGECTGLSEQIKNVMHKIKIGSKNRHFFALLFFLLLRSLWVKSSKWFFRFSGLS